MLALSIIHNLLNYFARNNTCLSKVNLSAAIAKRALLDCELGSSQLLVSEVLINFDAESKEEVDAMAEKVRKAGGKIYAEPGESQGWMYAFGFEDLDGHRWSMLYMDLAKMPK